MSSSSKQQQPKPDPKAEQPVKRDDKHPSPGVEVGEDGAVYVDRGGKLDEPEKA